MDPIKDHSRQGSFKQHMRVLARTTLTKLMPKWIQLIWDSLIADLVDDAKDRSDSIWVLLFFISVVDLIIQYAGTQDVSDHRSRLGRLGRLVLRYRPSNALLAGLVVGLLFNVGAATGEHSTPFWGYLLLNLIVLMMTLSMRVNPELTQRVVFVWSFFWFTIFALAFPLIIQSHAPNTPVRIQLAPLGGIAIFTLWSIVDYKLTGLTTGAKSRLVVRIAIAAGGLMVTIAALAFVLGSALQAISLAIGTLGAILVLAVGVAVLAFVAMVGLYVSRQVIGQLLILASGEKKISDTEDKP